MMILFWSPICLLITRPGIKLYLSVPNCCRPKRAPQDSNQQLLTPERTTSTIVRGRHCANDPGCKESLSPSLDHRFQYFTGLSRKWNQPLTRVRRTLAYARSRIGTCAPKYGTPTNHRA